MIPALAIDARSFFAKALRARTRFPALKPWSEALQRRRRVDGPECRLCGASSFGIATCRPHIQNRPLPPFVAEPCPDDLVTDALDAKLIVATHRERFPALIVGVPIHDFSSYSRTRFSHSSIASVQVRTSCHLHPPCAWNSNTRIVAHEGDVLLIVQRIPTVLHTCALPFLSNIHFMTHLRISDIVHHETTSSQSVRSHLPHFRTLDTSTYQAYIR